MSRFTDLFQEPVPTPVLPSPTVTPTVTPSSGAKVVAPVVSEKPVSTKK
jgi:hypothetical protein